MRHIHIMRYILALVLFSFIYVTSAGARDLNETLQKSTGSGPPTFNQDAIDQKASDTKSTYARIVSMDDRVSNVETELRSLDSKVSAQFAALLIPLVQIGMTAIAISVTLLLFLSKIWIDYKMKEVEARHEQLSKDAQSKLDKHIQISTTKVAATIFSEFGAHSIKLYKDLPQPIEKSRKNLYESYLDIAVQLSYSGYSSSQKLKEMIDSREPSADEIAIFTGCLNNYAYYLAERSGQEQARTWGIATRCRKNLQRKCY